MRKFGLLVITLSLYSNIFSQKILPRPKLVVGIVVDQMRWDYLYRYYERYSETGGFKRMLRQGNTCENTFINYAPTVTACGHASIYTGTVPAINGIVGNSWYDIQTGQDVYCTGDKQVNTVGSSTESGKHSPANLLTTTIGDELRLATNFKGKVISIAIKDRGSVLPGGHSANASYWYDSNNGNWITSSHYMNELPKWATNFNAEKRVDKYYTAGWNTLYPISTYLQSTTDLIGFESKPFGAEAQGFPYNFDRFVNKNYSVLPNTPSGNTFTVDFAKAAIINEQLGVDATTDMLAISFSSPDYIGHAFGPNSIEVEDNYLRLDKELGNFFDFLDNKIGKGDYLCFLSADHGVVNVPGFLKQNKIRAGYTDIYKFKDELNPLLKNKFGKNNLIKAVYNSQIYLNLALIDSSALNLNEIKSFIINYLSNQPDIERVFDLNSISTTTLNTTIKDRFTNGFNAKRSGHIQIIVQPQFLEGYTNGGTGHSKWNPYDSHIPLLWYGWGIRQGQTNREVYMTDISATIAALLHIQMPSGCVGKVITEVMK